MNELDVPIQDPFRANPLAFAPAVEKCDHMPDAIAILNPRKGSTCDMLAHVAILKHLASGTESYLTARHLVGRAATCHLCIARPTVSGVHAEILWDGASWRVQDLGSRNGTFVDGRRLAAGEQATLAEGSTLIFGLPEHRYRLASASPPRLMATPDRGAPVIAEDDLLCLPTPESCEVSIFRDADDRWVVESDAGRRVLEEQDLVTAGGRAWRISLPASSLPTREARAELEPAVDDVELDLLVSRDGEHVTARLLEQGIVARELEHRAHLSLLVVLARRRLADAAQEHLPVSEHGWMYRDELLHELALGELQLLNLWIHRVRQQFIKAGVRGAGAVIERRAGAQQIRIGLRKLFIRNM